MQQFGGKDSKRHFTVVIGGKRASPLTPPPMPVEKKFNIC